MKEELTSPASWDRSSYLKRKRARREALPAQWFTSEQGDKYLVRKVGLLAPSVAARITGELTDEALRAWQDNGLEIPTNGNNSEEAEAADLKELIKIADRATNTMARVISNACLIPQFIPSDSIPETKPAWADVVAKALDLDVETFNWRSVIVDPTELEEHEVKFLYKCALGLAPESPVELKGGESTTVASLKSVSSKSRKRSTASARS